MTIISVYRKGDRMKRIVSIIGVLLIASGLSVYAKTDFTDITETDWFSENVEVLALKGIIGGFPDGTFRAEETMTVDQFIKTMIAALGYELSNGDEYWAEPYINQAIELEIMSESDFKDYTLEISRAEMAKLAVKTIELLEGEQNYQYDPSKSSLIISSISDKDQLFGFDTEKYVSNSYELGIITGYPDGSFKPENGLKRSEACTVIRRVIDASIREPFVETTISNDELAVFEEHGYLPFSSGFDESVISKEILKTEAENFSFDSGLAGGRQTFDREPGFVQRVRVSGRCR